MKMQSTKQQNKQRYVNEDEEADGERFESKMSVSDDANELDPKLPSRIKSKGNNTNSPTRESPESSGPGAHPKDGDASSTSQIPDITLVEFLLSIVKRPR